MSDEAKGGGRALAVALHYDHKHAPRVVAKGHGTVAERILELAREHDVPVEDNPVLAGMLATLDLDEEIPEELYAAVAEIISYVLSFSRTRPGFYDRAPG
ncbi:MAG: EscU/YscU/HrcU family type III secretion system export apparatus switch protein [Rhodobiaceae bacterium]|nr:EscU/YscU/HrcU family type III secretion system export apparatus switch protein [Rhodobiaceae bacterium]